MTVFIINRRFRRHRQCNVRHPVAGHSGHGAAQPWSWLSSRPRGRGVSILGGTGTVIGSTLAAILLNTIRSAMVFINVSPFWLQAVQGILILVTVLVDILRGAGN